MWLLSPRQIAGFVTLAALRRRRELAEQLWVAAQGARGDPKELKKLMRELGA